MGGTTSNEQGGSMADAIVLITTESDMVSEAAKCIVELDGVQDVYSVAGDVDLVAVVSTDHFEDLTSVIPEGIAKVDGVVGTQTLMAFRTYSREDEQAAFDLGGD
jgi:DNA-binding Lrp family transcriptional regulator